MKSAKRHRVDVNLDELDRVLDGARQAPLSEADCDKLKSALHALAAMLAPARHTEKTSAVLEEPENPATGDETQPGSNASPQPGHGRNGAEAFGGARTVDIAHQKLTHVVKAKQAISSYKKAVGEPGGLAELMVYYCECAAGFCNDLGNQDEGYIYALVRMFDQALKVIGQLPALDRNALIARLDRVRVISHNFGYGVGDEMDSLLARHRRA